MTPLDIVIENGTSVVDVATAVATVAAVLVALFGPPLWRWWFRPVLAFQYEPREPFCRVTTMSNDGATVFPTKWIRANVLNSGRGTARGCKGKLLAVSDAAGNRRTDRDPMRLRWSATPRDHELEPLDLASGETQFLDVVFSMEPDTQWVHIACDPTPPGFATALEANQTHRIRVAVYADNTDAEPHHEDFEVTFDGTVTGLHMRRI